MNKVWLVIKREYLTRVRTKGFVIGTIAIPLFSVGIFVFSILMATRMPDRTLRIAVVDETGNLLSAIVQGLDGKLPNGQPEFSLVETLSQLSPAEAAKARQRLRKKMSEGELDGVLIVAKEVAQGKAAEFHTENPGDMRLADTIRRAVSDAVVAHRLKSRGLQVDNLDELMRGVDVALMKVSEEGEVKEEGQTFLTAMIVAMVLYITLIVYGVATMRSVLEEKTTRVVELLVSSLRPFQLLLGKILGVAAVGFTQYLIWTVTGGLLVAYGSGLARVYRPSASPPEIHLSSSMLIYSVVYFLAGYFLYASLYAATGAIASNEEEAQQVQMPMTFTIVAAFLLFNVVIHDPNSTASIILSLIPFFSPILMILRIALETPPFWQIALSIVLLLATTAGVVFAAGKIYRIGILMYGKRPSLAEVWRWLHHT